MINEILLRRKNKIYLEREVSCGPAGQERRVLTMMKNIESLGYVFSQEAFENLCRLAEEELDAFYLELTALLKMRVGADKDYLPMYPDFPQEVMEKSWSELYFNAMVHYWSYGTLYPTGKKRERLPLFDETKVSVLSMGTKEELMEIFRNLAEANSSLSEQDRQDICWYFEKIPDAADFLPENIPNKENAAYIGRCCLEHDPMAHAGQLKKYIRTGADVLRLAAALSDGDPSLKEKVSFKSFKRRERRILMDLLEASSGLLEEMHHRPEMWKRLGERLHPGEYHTSQYAGVRNAFEKLRAGRHIENFAGKVERALLEHDVERALMLLKERPGELARRLDLLLRLEPACVQERTSVRCTWESFERRMQKLRLQKAVLDTFELTAGQVATPVLLQVRTHFQYRNQHNLRYYFPKGKIAQARTIKNIGIPLKTAVCQRIVSICEQTLISRFSELPSMGKVYLSEELKNYIVPFNQRSASKAARTLVRGSRLPVDGSAEAVRGFIWWTNLEDGGRVDIDLSAAIFDEHWQYVEHVSYTNLRSERYRACHSGDIVNGGPAGGDGVCEFLDVDMDSIVKYGGRYVVYQAYNYTRQSFADIPRVFFGYMERQEVNSGEIFEPRLVRQQIDLATESVVAVPMILDCVSRRMIWCDMALILRACRSNLGGNNLESNLSGVTLACYAMVNMHKANLYDLLKLHVDGRGEMCNEKEKADMIFDAEEGITPFDTDIILAEYMR